MSKQTKGAGISVSLQKCLKISRNSVNLIDLELQLPEKILLLTPLPPTNMARLWRRRKIMLLLPPPTDTGRLVEITENLPGGPPPQKSWLRRCNSCRSSVTTPLTRQHSDDSCTKGKHDLENTNKSCRSSITTPLTCQHSIDSCTKGKHDLESMT